MLKKNPIKPPPLLRESWQNIELYQNIVMNYRISGNYCCLRRPHKGNYTSKFSPAALITKAIILIIAKYTSNFSPAAPNYKSNYP